MTAKQLLQASLNAMGPNGENWIKGFQSNGKACVVDTCWNSLQDTRTDYAPPEYIKAMNLLISFVPSPWHSIAGYNDAPDTDFTDIKLLFQKAIAIAD